MHCWSKADVFGYHGSIVEAESFCAVPGLQAHQSPPGPLVVSPVSVATLGSLQESFSGNAFCTMIATVSGAARAARHPLPFAGCWGSQALRR